MFSRRTFATLAASALCALALANSPGPASTPGKIRFGPTHGAWQLGFGAQNGFVDGHFYEAQPATTPSAPPRYHFTATLVAGPVMCPNCVAGTLQGTLDDGVGPSPDYVVLGHYSGVWSTGKGSFSASIYRPTSAAPVGSVGGTYDNPPLLPVIGHYSGKWIIRN